MPLHRLPADPRRRLRPRTARPRTTTWRPRCAAPAPAVVPPGCGSSGAEFARPADLAEALALLAEQPDATVVAGLHRLGRRGQPPRHPRPVRRRRRPAARAARRSPSATTSIEIGAALTLSEVERLLDGRVPLLDQLWPQFASRLIRNGATLGGNLGTGSPIGDAPPALLALEASVVLAGPSGEREVPLADVLHRLPPDACGEPGELIRAVRIPLPLAPLAAFHKIAKRRFDDISSVAVGLRPRRRGTASSRRRRDRARRRRGHPAAGAPRPRPRSSAGRGPPTPCGTAAAVLRGEGTPIDDHRASAAYRAAMLGQCAAQVPRARPRHRRR